MTHRETRTYTDKLGCLVTVAQPGAEKVLKMLFALG